MMVGKLGKIRNFFFDIEDMMLQKKRRHNEVKKYEDKRRVEIYSKVNLTKEQCNQIDELYLKNYGEKIPYTWHRHFTAYTGRFDVKYIPELLFIPEFEHYMNKNEEFCKVFSDKNMLPFLAKAVGVKMPKTYLSSTRGVYRDDDYHIISYQKMCDAMNNLGEAFVKPAIDSCSGNGCRVIHMQNGIDVLSGKTTGDILKILGDDFAIQERLECHESIKKIYADSVNTFRVITYRWKEEIIVMPVIMRIGQGGSYLDNAHAGGMFIAVSNEGILGEKAFTEFKKEYIEHPDTHLKFCGYKIELFDTVISQAKSIHEAMPQVGCVNWDFTLDKDGIPILLEGNMTGGSIWLIEMAHGCGVFGENTEEVLRWLKLMKSTPQSEQSKYAFGKGV